ncbi:Protein of unknown function [Bacillus wiedmannii]|uniref:Uncharacterized protein n=1 Tax=Bacillus wiedmannii TaxID=1890302 RepID=A0AB37Z0I3_9BACI|nr:Protein of unknown function [Bacillus wiedmannii]
MALQGSSVNFVMSLY